MTDDALDETIRYLHAVLASITTEIADQGATLADMEQRLAAMEKREAAAMIDPRHR